MINSTNVQFLKLIFAFLVQEVNKPSPHLLTVLQVKCYGFSNFTIFEGFKIPLLRAIVACHGTYMLDVIEATPRFDLSSIFCSVTFPLPSIHVLSLRFVSSAVPEILGTYATPPFGRSLLDIFLFLGLLSLTVNLPAKFEVCNFSRSRYIRGVPKFEK